MIKQTVAAALALVAAVAVPAAAGAQTEKRVALVIGNDAYQTLPRLGNATTDARDIGRALELTGFDTTVRTDVKRRELYQLIDAFAAKIAATPDTVGLFYYAGHGIQTNGKNYLVPVDANLTSDADLEPEAVDAGKVLGAMDQARNRINIVILDACRDNPLPKGRSLARGLTQMHAPRGTFIGYAAAPGQTAQDGEPGENGAFTGVLVKQLAVPGLQLEEVFKRVIAGVSARTGGKQLPWMESSVQGNFFFLPANASGSASTQASSATIPTDAEIVFWQSIPRNAAAADYEEYLRQFPQGRFAGLARNRLAMLKSQPPNVPPRSEATAIAPTPEARGRPRSAQEVCATLDDAGERTLYCASSVLAPQAGNSYGVNNLFDHNASTAWVAGRSGPIGEWVVVDFGVEKVVKSITIHNGYQKNTDVFYKNSRVRQLRLVFSNGSNLDLTIADRAGAQQFRLPAPIKAKWVQLVINEIYPGTKYADIGISELWIEAEGPTEPAAPAGARQDVARSLAQIADRPPISLELSGTRLSWPGGSTRAAVGKGGLRANKKEGDGATPIGTFPLLFGLYRADRVAPPAVAIPMKPLQRVDAWVDDPADPKYNQLASVPYPARVEELWREDGLYDLLVVIGYNMSPIVSGAGSAIFLHVARPNFSPTDGCIAVSREALLKLVTLITPGSTITIRP